MIILQTGIYTKKQIASMDIGTTNNELPTTKLDVIISNPIGFHSYCISKIREGSVFKYRIAIL